MKIGLLTLDAQIYNYGGILQEFALCQALNKLGHKVEIINYEVASELNTFSIKRNIKYLTYDKVVRKLEKKIHYKGSYSSRVLDEKSKRKFEDFRETYLDISQRYNYNNLNDIKNAYDGFVCGSDQIWNPAYNIPSFFLTFVNDKVKVIYAASVGVSSLSKTEKNVYTELLTGLKYISVREDDAQRMLSPLTSVPIEVVLDPTMILDRNIWLNFVQDNTKQKQYLLCYFLSNNADNVKAAEKYAQKKELKLVTIPLQTDSNADTIPFDGIGPVEFLNLIYNAKFILTDSFHASVFSIIFNKPFRVFGRNVGHKNMNNRLMTLLELIDAKDFLILPEELELTSVDENCFYDFSRIDAKKKKSIDWLDSALNEREWKND